MSLEKVDPKETNPALLGNARQPVRKIPFNLDDISFFDTSYMCDPLTGHSMGDDNDSDQEDWDAPLRRTTNVSSHILDSQRSPYKSSANTSSYDRSETML